MSVHGRLGRSSQRGFSLIVALMMLIVIIILGISASQMAVNEERGARNYRDRQLAFQAAEAALQDGEAEILSTSQPACALPGQFGRGRQGSQICFNHASGVFFAVNCASSPATAVGLCAYSDTSPAFLSSNVNFLGDASGSGGNGNTVKYGTFTNKTYPSQQQSANAGHPISIYPPRYIIEFVPQNVAPAASCTSNGGATGCGVMFRVTAIGFGANPNSQVVLQSVVSTQD